MRGCAFIGLAACSLTILNFCSPTWKDFSDEISNESKNNHGSKYCYDGALDPRSKSLPRKFQVVLNKHKSHCKPEAKNILFEKTVLFNPLKIVHISTLSISRIVKLSVTRASSSRTSLVIS